MEHCEREVEFAERLSKAEERSKSNQHRLDELESWQRDQSELVKSVSIMATKQERIETDVTEIKADVKAIAAKPGKRWDSIADKLIWLIVGAAIAALLAQAGIAV